jgi:hypothetical protein
MSKTVPCLWSDGVAEQAAALDTAIFPGPRCSEPLSR